MTAAPTLEERLRGCTRSAVHLEMRDIYMPSDPRFAAWRAGDRSVRTADEWLDLVRDLTSRGVEVRRARIVSEPVSDYIAFEHQLTDAIVAAGEQVRWLSRRQASGLSLPGNDCWVLDGNLVVFHHFDGDGELAPDGDEEAVANPAVVKLCAAAFDAVWERAVPHGDWQPTTL